MISTNYCYEKEKKINFFHNIIYLITVNFCRAIKAQFVQIHQGLLQYVVGFRNCHIKYSQN